jgi:hypothetical protein
MFFLEANVVIGIMTGRAPHLARLPVIPAKALQYAGISVAGD